MHLVAFGISGFQSYRYPQTLEFHPNLTFLAGRNDVGKSATLRALRLFVEPQEGVRRDFVLSYTWKLTAAELLRLALPVGTSAPEAEAWIRSVEDHTFSAEIIPNGLANPMPTNQLFFRRVALVELDAFAEGAPATSLGWQGGPFGGASTFSEYLVGAARGLASRVSFVGPRRPETGRQQLLPTRVLQPDARNLTQVLSYLIMNERMTTFARLEEFIRGAFPQIASIGAPVPDDRGQPPSYAEGELHVYYVGREADPVPLRLCGTGIEQMLALATGILTAADPRLFLIDEPQAYLHPDAERSLLSLLTSNSQHQYVIATHSGFLLSARPLSQARLLTMQEGATQLIEGSDVGEILSELGVTAADLWLAESILWVEGASEFQVIDSLVSLRWPEAPRNLRIRPMPDASRFASRSARQAEATYRFCEAVAEAVAPLSIEMRFLFDADEKSQEVREQILASSRGRAVFLPVRELENLFLDAEAIQQVLGDLCARVDHTVPTLDQVRARLDAEFAAIDDGYLYPEGAPENGDPSGNIVGSHVLERLWWDFARASYDKVTDGKQLVAAVFRHNQAKLDPLTGLVDELLRSDRPQETVGG